MENSDLLLPHLVSTYNLCISESYFPNELKAWDISSLVKKDDAFSETNFKPITVLSSFSKIFQRLMYEQVMNFAKFFCLLYYVVFGNAIIRNMRFKIP